MHKAIKNMVNDIRVLFNSTKNNENASKKSKVTQARQMVPAQNPKYGNLEKWGKDGENDFYGSSQDPKRQKSLLPE